MRVAVVQFEVTDNIEANLQTCLRIIDQAQAECEPDLIVLPEYCNHPPLWRDAEHCYAVAEHPDGPFLSSIAKKSKALRCMIQVNVTMRYRNNVVRNTNTMFGPDGSKLDESSKSFLISGENFFLEKPDKLSDVMETPFGTIGMYSCMDGVSMEVTRALSLRGAQLLSNSLCSYATDEDWLHIPVRAAENKVFVAAANKVGRLVPEGLIPVLAGDHDPQDARGMMGSGASQIVAPDGTVLARAPVDTEAIVWADIDLDDATKKLRPDGSDIFADRRPALYGPIVAEPRPRGVVEGAERLLAAVAHGSVGDALADAMSAVSSALDRGVEFLTLPELAFLPDGKVDNVLGAADIGRRGIEAVAEVLFRTDHACLVATSVVHAEDGKVFHRGVLIGREGLLFHQDALHRCGRHKWVTAYGNDVSTIDFPAGRFGLVVGGDTAIPETFRLLALKDAWVVGAPTRILEGWEAKTGFLERSAENRLSLVVATQPTAVSGGVIVTPDKGFAHDTPRADRQRPARTLNWPIAVQADRDSQLTASAIYPKASVNRLCRPSTDLVAGRPWALSGAITEAKPAG